MTASPPDLAKLISWLDQTLPADEQADVSRQIEADPRTRRWVDWLRELQRSGRWSRTNQPPARVAESLAQAYDHWWARRSSTAAVSEEAWLDLVFDSRTDLIGAGTRGHSSGPGFQLAFQGDAADVLLEVTPLLDRRVRIEGQLLAPEPVEGLVEVRLSGPVSGRASAIADPLGRFAFGNVPATVQELSLTSDRLRLRMNIELRG